MMLPAERNQLVGRDEDVARVGALLRDAPIVTLLGPGGVGKTRLALRIANGFATQIWWCELAALTAGPSVVTAVAARIGVADAPGRDLLAAVADQLRGSAALVVLDNCEHVIDEAAAVADTIAGAAPGVVVVATSREPLGVPGEVVHRVEPLAAPPEGDVGDPSAWPAVELFVARLAESGRGARREDAPVIAQICRRLDGVPLTRELAAGRARSMTPAQILAAMDDRFGLLSSGRRVGSARARTLEASVAWSYDLLPVVDRAAFRTLSVFAGSWDLDAAAQVVGTTRSADVASVVTRLVDRSLVVAEPDGSAMRYRMLETIREFGRRELVAAGEDDDARTRHFVWLQSAVIGNLLRIADDGESALAALDALRADVAVALEHAVSSDPAAGARLASLLRFYWFTRGRYREGLEWSLTYLVALGTERSDATADAWVLASTMRQYLGDLRGAIDAADAARSIAEEVGDAAAAAAALNAAGWPHALLDPIAGGMALDEAAARAAAVGDTNAALESLLGRTSLALLTEGPTAASGPLDRGLALAAASGNATGRLALSAMAGMRGVLAADFAEAVAALRSVVDDLETTGFPYWSGFARSYLALFALAVGDVDASVDDSRTAAALGAQIGSPLLALHATVQLAWSLHARSDVGGVIDLADVTVREAASLGGWIADGGRAMFTALHARALVESDAPAALDLAIAAQKLAHGSPYILARAVVGIVSGTVALAVGDSARAEQHAADAFCRAVDAGLLVVAPDALDVLAHAASATGSARSGRAERLANAAAAERRRAGTFPLHLGPGITAATGDAIVDSSLAEIASWLRRGKTTRRRPSTGWESLTPAERSVVDLVIEGLTNADVAARLFMSPRTVSTHLSHVFAKLGVGTRTELATAAARSSSNAP